jgi:Protein of unknown function (DUF4007)
MSNSQSVGLIAESAVSAAKYSFARHETFHPRFGWVKKGFDAVSKNPDIFFSVDAHIQLGVGKNMAASIRHWCSAFKVIEPLKTEDERLRGNRPSRFGEQLLSVNGWDPFLEDLASLWLLHWNLLKSPCQATAWKFIFDEFHKADFTRDDLLNELFAYRNKLSLKVRDSSLEKDITCLLRMYVDQQHKKHITEETLDCPFVELGIIQSAGDPQHYTFRVGAKSSLPSAIIVAAALEYVAHYYPEQRTISIASLTYGKSSPGLAFKLTESAICQAIDDVSYKPGGVDLMDTAGLLQMSFRDEPIGLMRRILKHYYER